MVLLVVLPAMVAVATLEDTEVLNMYASLEICFTRNKDPLSLTFVVAKIVQESNIVALPC